MEHLGLASVISQLVGLREGWGNVIHLPFLLWRELHPTLTPWAPLQLLAHISNASSGSQQDQQSVFVLHKQLEWLNFLEGSNCPWCPAPLIIKTQCYVALCSQSRAPGPGVQRPEPLPSLCLVPLPPDCGWGWARAGFPLLWGPAPLPFSGWSSLLPQV